MNKFLFSIGVLSLTTFCFWSNSLAQKVIDLDTGDEDVRILGVDAGDHAGERLATGDINGDGVDDLIISATQANGGTGVVYVIFGATTLPSTINLATADITILGENSGDVFGWGLETGDVNNDNFDDILVGAVDASPSSRAEAGKAYVIFGGSSLPSVIDLSITPADFTILGDDAGDKLGVRVASGDVNDDGIDDFIVGALQEADPFRPGKVYVVFGNSTLPSLIDLSSQSADVTILGEAGGDQFGISVWSGDVNGDSVDDILVGANLADTPSGADAGRAYVIYGDSLLPSIIDLSSTAADLTILGVDGGFGFPIRSGDVNGDTIEDIVVAAPGADAPGRIDAGEIVVIFGSGSLPNTIDLGSTPPDVDILGENAGDIFSGFPFTVKDVNNDMIDDIIAGALLADPSGRTDAGKSYMLSGRNSWPTVIDLSTAPADITIWGDDANDLSGVSIAAGDVNDDGINDIIVGALTADPLGVSDAGEAYIIFGEQKVVATVNCPSAAHENCPISACVEIDMSASAELLGSFTAMLTWDPTQIAYVSDSGILSGFTGLVNTDSVAVGKLSFNGASASGVSGVFDILCVNYDVIGAVNDAGDVSLSFSAMAAALTFTDLLPVLGVTNCPYTIVTGGLLGDVNGDGFVNSTDALIILSFDVGLPIPQPFLDLINVGFGDVNADGFTNSTDALIVLSFDVGLPVPFPVGQQFCP